MSNCKEKDEVHENIAARLQERIVGNGRISLDGAILSLEDLNRDVDVDLTEAAAQEMARWIQTQKLGEINRKNAKVVVVESSGNMLAAFLTKALGLGRAVVIKKGVPGTYYGETLIQQIHSFTRGQPTTISVEKRQLAGKRVISVDDFLATGETQEAVRKMVKEAGGELIAICAAISKPTQGSGKIMEEIPSFSLVTIEKMIPENDSQPATIKFAEGSPQVLKKHWGEE